MNKINLYWSVYKNLEKEVLKLANTIHFNDAQLTCYSMYIGELIIRCSVEIESISKELYFINGGEGEEKDLFFDTDCIEFLNNKFKICKKEINVTATNMFFEVEKNKVLQPLNKSNKRGTSGSNWKQAYQGIKHNRNKELKNANLSNLLNALGALFILNSYYKVDKIYLGRDGNDKLDCTLGSEIFVLNVVNATNDFYNYVNNSYNEKIIEQLDKAVLIFKYMDNTYKKLDKAKSEDDEITERNIRNSPAIMKYVCENPDKKFLNVSHLCNEVGGIDLVAKTVCLSNWVKAMETACYEVTINKHEIIYPSN